MLVHPSRCWCPIQIKMTRFMVEFGCTHRSKSLECFRQNDTENMQKSIICRIICLDFLLVSPDQKSSWHGLFAVKNSPSHGLELCSSRSKALVPDFMGYLSWRYMERFWKWGIPKNIKKPWVSILKYLNDLEWTRDEPEKWMCSIQTLVFGLIPMVALPSDTPEISSFIREWTAHP